VEELVRLDPSFMPAVELLSYAHVRASWTADNAVVVVAQAEEAKRSADRATSLMPGGAGDAALAYYHFAVRGDYGRV